MGWFEEGLRSWISLCPKEKPPASEDDHLYLVPRWWGAHSCVARAGENTRALLSLLFVAENGHFGTPPPFSHPHKPSKRLLWVTFGYPLPGHEAHQLSFAGRQQGGFWAGSKHLILKKPMGFFLSLA